MPRIAAEYGDRANDIVKSRPYELTSVFGVGFQIADTIARAAGVPRDSRRPHARGGRRTC